MDKKQISIHKFMRIAKDRRSKRVRGLYSSASFILALEKSIDAYVLGEFIYMWVPIGKSKYNSNRIKTTFLRYRLGSPKAIKECVIAGGTIQ